jgi:hypothetical protein
MTKRIKLLMMVMVLLAIISTSTLVNAAFSAYAFGDYYYMLKSSTASQEKLNGFWLRRVYLTYDADISDKIKARARLEMNSDGKLGSSELTLTPYIKDAYVSYQFLPLHSISIGIQESLTFNNIEKFWGYRHLEKPPFDLYKNRSSREFGVSLKGSFDTGKKFNYSILFGNFSGYKEEIDKYKTIAASFVINAIPNLMLEVNGDYGKRSATKKTYLLQAFAGYQGDWGRLGLNYGWETIKENGKEDVDFGVFSAFLVGKFSPKIEALVRYDMTADPQVNGNDRFFLIEKGYKTNLFIAGLGWNIHPKFQLMPNIKIVSYKENNGVKPESFSQFNVTFYYVF